MTPDEFWQSTPYEFSLRLRAHHERLYEQQQLVAWGAANIMNCWLERPVTPGHLLGETVNLDNLQPDEISAKLQAAKEKSSKRRKGR